MFFFFIDTAPTDIYLYGHTLSLHDALPISLAMQFLIEGARRKEPTLYVTLSESAAELKSVGLSHGWSFDGITIRELAASEEALRPGDQYTMFHPSEVEQIGRAHV